MKRILKSELRQIMPLAYESLWGIPAVHAITIDDDGTISAAAGSEVYEWDLGEEMWVLMGSTHVSSKRIE